MLEETSHPPTAPKSKMPPLLRRLSRPTVAFVHDTVMAAAAFVLALYLRVGDDFYYPDVFVSCDRVEGERLFRTRPSLIVEVLSPGTELLDTRDKLQAYQRIESLREYAIVEQERHEVRVIGRTAHGWESATYAGAMTVRFASVDLTLSLNDIYRDVEA